MTNFSKHRVLESFRPVPRSEQLLDRMSWQEDEPAQAPPGSSGERRRPLRRAERTSGAERVRRAVGVPIAAGIAVLVLAVAGAVAIAVVQGIGGGAPPSVQSEFGSPPGEFGSEATRDPRASSLGGADPGEPVFVHVVGAVRSPGVLELDAGSRVRDAIEAAGGAADGAVLGALNLARRVSDGEQIVVPDAASATSGTAGGAEGGAAVGAPSADGRINLNTAAEAELDELPGIGPALAERIAEWRQQNGYFASIDELQDIPGIGPKVWERLRERVVV